AGAFGGGGADATGGSAGAFGGSAGTGASGGANGGSTSNGGFAGNGGSSAGGGTSEPSFILGADVSSGQEAVDDGAVYIDTDGVQKSMLALLKNHGFNYIRLRTFVNPAAPYGYAQGTGGSCQKDEAYCDKAHTIEFAQQIKAAGMGLLLDFHY